MSKFTVIERGCGTVDPICLFRRVEGAKIYILAINSDSRKPSVAVAEGAFKLPLGQRISVIFRTRRPAEVGYVIVQTVVIGVIDTQLRL